MSFGTDAVKAAAALLEAGDCVAVPTETVYGLAGDATSSRAIAAIYAAKGRPAHNPLIVHVEDCARAQGLGVFSDTALGLANRHWPGPLTLVVPAQAAAGLAGAVTADLSTVALRVPAHRAIRAILAATGKPLAAPSANASGTISPTSADHVLRTLEGRIPLVVDDGPTPGGLESTILAIEGEVIRILRHGPLDVFGWQADIREPDRLEAPGQMASHYAPSKPLRLNVTAARDDEWHIGFGTVTGDANLSLAGDLDEAGKRLFALLHDADQGPAEKIAVASVPEVGVGKAINDRLRRAAAQPSR